MQANQLIPIRQIAEQCFLNSKAKGFWEEGIDRNKTTMVMLMISELSESLEFDRIHKWFSEIPDATWGKDFKDTVEEELADTFIRVLDYMHGWNLGNIVCEKIESMAEIKVFPEALFWITSNIVTAHRNADSTHQWNYVLSSIYTVCGWYNIDLFRFIELKMKYNSTRAYKHNNKKY